MEDSVDPEDEDTEGEKEEDEKEPMSNKRGRKPQAETFTIPTLLADDARAHRLLQPSIRSMMSKLDELALAIRRTRINHFGGGRSAGSSQSEFTSGADSSEPARRSFPRVQSKSAMSREPSTRPSSCANSAHPDRSVQQTKKVLKNRAKLCDSDAASSSPFDSDINRNTSRQRKRRRSSSKMSDSSASTIHDGLLREGLLDWSELLGLAALKGWDERAIARTAQRCAVLFDENMSFIPFHEALASKPAAKPVLYTPSLVPAPDILSISEPTAPKRPFFQPGMLQCPHTDCFGHEKDFALPYRVVEHCIRAHGYDPRTNDSDNEERTFGGVHIDGFLQPVAAKPGWLGNGRSKAGKVSKKQRKGQRDHPDPEVPKRL
jgi:N-terminal acetyltransferase B complex catalytic subunit